MMPVLEIVLGTVCTLVCAYPLLRYSRRKLRARARHREAPTDTVARLAWPPADVARCINSECVLHERCARWVRRNQPHAKTFMSPPGGLECIFFIPDDDRP